VSGCRCGSPPFDFRDFERVVVGVNETDRAPAVVLRGRQLVRLDGAAGVGADPRGPVTPCDVAAVDDEARACAPDLRRA
jgi:hypothetical protein